ncbi:MAG: hypothetical protein M3153_10955 [Chloroflexota bacterium]|nr:hypothetical protein [Chloroflexota bacterium]
MAIDHGTTPPRDATPQPDSAAEWRWRNYTEHLSDLGYDLGNGSAAGDDDSVGSAVSHDLSRRASER